jgi:virulence factor
MEHIYARNNFTPTLPNNQVYSQGYFSELKDFTDAVEGRQRQVFTDLSSVRAVYEIMATIQEMYKAQE